MSYTPNYILIFCKKQCKYEKSRTIKYQKIILTDVIGTYIYELQKFEKYEQKADKVLNSWVNFIENPEVVDIKENKGVS